MTYMTNSAALEELNEMLSFVVEFAQQMLHGWRRVFEKGAFVWTGPGEESATVKHTISIDV